MSLQKDTSYTHVKYCLYQLYNFHNFIKFLYKNHLSVKIKEFLKLLGVGKHTMQMIENVLHPILQLA